MYRQLIFDCTPEWHKQSPLLREWLAVPFVEFTGIVDRPAPGKRPDALSAFRWCDVGFGASHVSLHISGMDKTDDDAPVFKVNGYRADHPVQTAFRSDIGIEAAIGPGRSRKLAGKHDYF